MASEILLMAGCIAVISSIVLFIDIRSAWHAGHAARMPFGEVAFPVVSWPITIVAAMYRQYLARRR